jgi:folate-binding protein YgfZ
LETRGIVRIGGADRVAFLQGLVSNDVAAVSPTRAVYACLLTAQGKFQFDFFMLAYRDSADGDSLLLETDDARLGDLMKRLRLYKLRSAVDIADVSADFAVWALPDAKGEAGAAEGFHGGVKFVDPRLASLGARALMPKAKTAAATADFLRASAADYERRRLALGVPDSPHDLVPEDSTLMESNIDALAGISWDKGCYMGQELTARMRYRGLAKKKIFIVRFAGEAPPPGTPITDGVREAGEMRSSLVENGEGIGLALLRLDAAGKALNGEVTLKSAGADLTPALPDYLPRDLLAAATVKP